MLHQFVRTGSKQPPMPGSMGIPLPPPGMFGGGGEGGTSSSGGGGGEEESSEPVEPESERLVRRPSTSNRSGCFCNSNGCSGSDCSTMNGCVCSQGACWGAACDSRIPVTPSSVTSPMLTSGNLISTSALPLTNPLTNPIQLVRNALFASSPVVSVNGQPTNQAQQSAQQQSGNSVTIGDCSCNNLGCTGSGCANMNGCFCVGSNCWGNACNVNSMVQTSGNLLAPLQQANQMQLPNLAGRLTLPNGQLNGQLTLPTGQLNLPRGQLTLNNGQTANLLDIPGLGGAGGILNSLLPGAFGGGGLNPFGGGGGGGGMPGGMDFGGQGMQVVQGMPVKRLTATRARRIRGQAARGRPGMEFAATRGRVRPSHTVRKRIRPIQETDESRSFAVVPDQQMDPVLSSLLHLNQLTNEGGQSGNSSVTALDETINLNDSSLVDSSINQEQPEESVDVFTLTDQWI